MSSTGAEGKVGEPGMPLEPEPGKIRANCWHEPVHSASDGPLSFLWSGLMVGGVYCGPDTRVLVKDQPNPEDNGIYVVKNRQNWERENLCTPDGFVSVVFVLSGSSSGSDYFLENGKWFGGPSIKNNPCKEIALP